MLLPIYTIEIWDYEIIVNLEEESKIEIEKFKELQKEKKKARAEKLAKLMGKNTEEIKDESKENN